MKHKVLMRANGADPPSPLKNIEFQWVVRDKDDWLKKVQDSKLDEKKTWAFLLFSKLDGKQNLEIFLLKFEWEKITSILFLLVQTPARPAFEKWKWRR